MSSNTLLYLSRQDVESLDLSMMEVIDALDEMFKEKGEGRVEMPPKPGIHPHDDSFIHAMPAYIPSLQAAGMKWISAYPHNREKKLPYITGLVLMNDPETGVPLAVMDGTWITAARTGAATAVAAKYLARKDSSTAGILACGVQGRSNLKALSCLFDLKKVKTFDLFPEVAQKFAKEMSEVIGVDIEVVDNQRDAVVDLDLVVTSGPLLKDPSPVIEAGWLSEGAFASPVDFDSYWKGEAFAQADKLGTDDLEQFEYYRDLGYLQNTPVPYADLGEIAAGKKPGRENDSERIICANLGLALDDMAAGIRVYQKAIEKGIGTKLPL